MESSTTGTARRTVTTRSLRRWSSFSGSMYAPLADTQVGAHFWCIGEHVARYRSAVQETMGEHVGREYHSVHQYTFSENVLAMLERGEDAQAAAIERGHALGMHVYASVRR